MLFNLFIVCAVFYEVKRHVLIIFLFFSMCYLNAQSVQLISPREPVIEGNAFQVQYIITTPADVLSLHPPLFTGFRVVSGPHTYMGQMIMNGKLQPIENITYTLVASTKGANKINGMSVVFKNAGKQNSGDAYIMTVAPQNASFTARSNYTDVTLFAPATTTDREKLISENLFVKTIVDKSECFIGEPIVVSFILYSRLQSTSEVINFPSLYGFSALDMIDINLAHLSVDTLEGKIFNTALLRKLLLYPSVAGKLVIDPIQITNEVEFDDPESKGNKVKIETSMASPVININVKSLPKNYPQNYSGAVGHFTLDSRVFDTSLVTGRQGQLRVRLSGSGNFIQLVPPVLSWPQSFDVFEAKFTDVVDKLAVPAVVSREYTIGFTTQLPGNYLLPPVSFSFFNPTTRKFETISTKVHPIVFVKGTVPVKIIAAKKISNKHTSKAIIGLVAFVLLSGAAAFFFFRKKGGLRKKYRSPEYNAVTALRNIRMNSSDGQVVCTGIQKILTDTMHAFPHMSSDQKVLVQELIDDCQLLNYSAVYSEEEKERIFHRAEILLTEVHTHHSAYL